MYLRIIPWNSWIQSGTPSRVYCTTCHRKVRCQRSGTCSPWQWREHCLSGRTYFLQIIQEKLECIIPIHAKQQDVLIMKDRKKRQFHSLNHQVGMVKFPVRRSLRSWKRKWPKFGALRTSFVGLETKQWGLPPPLCQWAYQAILGDLPGVCWQNHLFWQLDWTPKVATPGVASEQVHSDFTQQNVSWGIRMCPL